MNMQNILSVGIDIGTSTTQLVFSRISMENTSGYFAVPHISVVAKDVIYKSDIYMTPLKSAQLIDGAGVKQIVMDEYRKKGYTPQDVDTGAVIVTGESSRKENAEEVLQNLSDFAGDFVVSTAGPDLESVIAGKGSGAYRYSIDNECTVINLDIGGGTTNIVAFDNGETVFKTCYDIGGRLIRLTKEHIVESISPAARRIAEAVGVNIRPGQHCTDSELSAVTDKMAELLSESVGFGDSNRELLKAVKTAESSDFNLHDKRAAAVFFSGGVADCIENNRADPIAYGDIGVLLGRSIRMGALYKSGLCVAGSETIRATVVGAGTYTTSISGSTISYASQLLPMKNIPALKLSDYEQSRCFSGDSAFLAKKMRWFMEQSSTERLALAMTGMNNPDYTDITSLAECLADSFDKALPTGAPAIVILEHDMAKALGIFLSSKLKDRHRLACIDGIKVEQGDYVDMGRPIMGGLVIPVVVKTLLFG